VKLAVRNASGDAQRVILADAGERPGSVPASLVATLAEFRRELGTQVLAPDVRIGTRSVALLFTDLSGSTAMYQAVGDAKAYALVRDHFRLLGDVIGEHGGVVVKTIGDAVMASFHAPGDAFEAALEMRTAFDGWIAGQGVDPVPRLNVGLHVGPALAVHSDAAGLDWFGSTVNLAARAQGAARGGELVMTAEVRADRRVDEALRTHGLAPAEFRAELKGIGSAVLYKLPPS
jgi:class 3 adenylate cyclase